MTAHCKQPDALDCGIEFALTQLSDDSIAEIAARLVAEHESTDSDADYLIASCVLHAFIALRTAVRFSEEDADVIDLRRVPQNDNRRLRLRLALCRVLVRPKHSVRRR